MSEPNIVSWELDGVRYDVDLHDLNGLEWREAKLADGRGLSEVQLVAVALGYKDFGATAAIIWIWRRRSEPELTYADVLGLFSLAALEGG